MLCLNFFNTYYFFKFPTIFSSIEIVCNNHNRGCQFQQNRIRTATAVLKIPQEKQQPQPRFSENSQPIHHCDRHIMRGGPFGPPRWAIMEVYNLGLPLFLGCFPLFGPLCAAVIAVDNYGILHLSLGSFMRTFFLLFLHNLKFFEILKLLK